MKIRAERPNAWYVIVTLAAMLYWAGWLPAVSEFFLSRTPAGWAMGILLVLVWGFLILDLIKQISLFLKSPRRK
jgi:hypothetical protein